MISKLVCSLVAFLLVACTLSSTPAVQSEMNDQEQPAPTLTSTPPTDLPAKVSPTVKAPPSPSPEGISKNDQEALKAEWRRAVTSVEIMFAVCEQTYNTNAAFQQGQIDQAAADADLKEKASFLELAQRSLLSWKDVSELVAPYRLKLDNLSFELADLMYRLMSGEMGSQEITQPLDDTCLALFNAQDEVVRAAMEAGLTEDSVNELDGEIKEIMFAIYK